MRRRRVGGGWGWRRGPGAWSWGGSLDGGELGAAGLGGGVGDGLLVGAERFVAGGGGAWGDRDRGEAGGVWACFGDVPAGVGDALCEAVAVVGGHWLSWSWWVAGQMGAEE